MLRRYPQAEGAEALLSHSPRPFSTAGVVQTPQGRVFVKRHPSSVRDREGLMEEHRLIAHLARAMRDEAEKEAASVLVQPVLVNEDGESVVACDGWTYEVHPVAKGLDVYEQALSWTPFLSVGHARAAGRALARLHNAAQGYGAPVRKRQQLVSSFTIFASADESPDSRMQRYLEDRPALRRYAEQRDYAASMDELLMPLFEKLAPWLPSLPPLWTHNDFHASNLTWSTGDEAAQVRGIIDFGLADCTNAVHDLATAIERNIVEWLRMDEHDADIVHLDHLDALLAGYEELRPLSYEEAWALVTMLPLAHCEFALSETDYFLSILHSPEKAYLAYEGYFLAHAQWFQEGQGRRLLEHLERWATAQVRSRAHSRISGGKA